MAAAAKSSCCRVLVCKAWELRMEVGGEAGCSAKFYSRTDRVMIPGAGCKSFD